MQKIPIVFLIVMFFGGLYLTKTMVKNNQPKSMRPKKTTIERRIERIIKQEKKEHDCKLSATEMKRAFGYYLEQNEIILSALERAALIGNNVVDGLYMVVKERKRPQYVYKRLELSKYDISEAAWIFYTKRYKDIESVDKLKRFVLLDKIISLETERFKSKLENWLLFEKIINDFDHKFPQAGDLTPSVKEYKWWAITLKKYKLSPKTYHDILERITVEYSLRPEEQKIMEEYFSQVKRVCQ